jgi:hypothetical protein
MHSRVSLYTPEDEKDGVMKLHWLPDMIYLIIASTDWLPVRLSIRLDNDKIDGVDIEEPPAHASTQVCTRVNMYWHSHYDLTVTQLTDSQSIKPSD